MIIFTSSPVIGPVLCFFLFESLWCLNEVAKELENPFGQEPQPQAKTRSPRPPYGPPRYDVDLGSLLQEEEEDEEQQQDWFSKSNKEQQARTVDQSAGDQSHRT